VQRFGRVMLLVLVMAACAGCDQATKAAAKVLLPSSGSITVLHHTIAFVYTENPGAFLSLGAGLSTGERFVLFTVAPGLILTVAFAFLLRSHGTRPVQDHSHPQLIGGGVGNLIDRLAHHGWVVDFIRLGVGPVRTGVFNVADAVIMVGVITCVVSILWARPTQQRPHAWDSGWVSGVSRSRNKTTKAWRGSETEP
jgi:signal peptidase II